MEITSQSKLFDILEAHPELESQIINIAPTFKNLKNPVLRRTVGKLATIEMVAHVGGMDVTKLVNTLRIAVGQETLVEGTPVSILTMVPSTPEDPEWIVKAPFQVVNGSELLKNGEVPLAKVNELLEKLPTGELILLVTDFEPSPIIEALKKKGKQVFHKIHPSQPGQHFTYIQ